VIRRLFSGPWAIVALLGVLSAAGLVVDHRAYGRGFETATGEARAAQARLEALVADRDSDLRAVLDQLRAARDVRAATIERIEGNANSDPGAARLAFPAVSVRRLRTRWGVNQD
jgi:hypothetical protein